MSEENNEQIVENLIVEPAPVVESEPVVESAPVVEPAPVVESEPIVEPAPVVEPAPQPMPDQNVITGPSHSVSEVPAVGIVGDGVIGSTVTKIQPIKENRNKKTERNKEETVAIFSTKNVTWSEVGKVYRGYNIVSKSAADKWLTRSHVRLATPEEVAKEFGK